MWTLLYPGISLINQFPIEKYKADFFHIPSRTVIETHGGVWTHGGHNTGVGVTSDCKKLCLCTSLGYKYFALTTEMINEEYLNMIVKTIGE
jgi:very-short-patch-repair endonuclease